MEIKPTVSLRAILVGGIAACAKIGGAMKAAGGMKRQLQLQLQQQLPCLLTVQTLKQIPKLNLLSLNNLGSLTYPSSNIVCSIVGLTLLVA